MVDLGAGLDLRAAGDEDGRPALEVRLGGGLERVRHSDDGAAPAAAALPLVARFCRPFSRELQCNKLNIKFRPDLPRFAPTSPDSITTPNNYHENAFEFEVFILIGCQRGVHLEWHLRRNSLRNELHFILFFYAK